MNNKKDDIAIQIKAFDEWFRHAENIGQQRLYNFLMVSSIMLVGCATLMASTKNIGGPSLAIFLSILGIRMSRMWYIQGRRQAKFHDMVERNLLRLFKRLGFPNNCEHCEELPIYHVYQMKMDIMDGCHCKTKLTCSESKWSNRLFLSEVPKLFGCAFFITLMITITVFACEVTTQASPCLCKYIFI
jgi:hypothetical protein